MRVCVRVSVSVSVFVSVSVCVCAQEKIFALGFNMFQHFPTLQVFHAMSLVSLGQLRFHLR